MANERYYRDVVQVIQTEDITKVNELLGQGLELLTIKDHSKQTLQEGRAVIESVPLYVLGEIREAPTLTHSGGGNVDLAGLEWRISSFSDKVESVPPDKIPAATKDFLQKRSSKFEDESYSYILTQSGWLNRRKKG